MQGYSLFFSHFIVPWLQFPAYTICHCYHFLAMHRCISGEGTLVVIGLHFPFFYNYFYSNAYLCIRISIVIDEVLSWMSHEMHL